MTKHTRTRILAGALTILIAAGAMTGCGGSTTKVGADETPTGKIVVGGWPAGDEGFQAAQAGFKTKYPDVEIEYQFMATADFEQSLNTALAAGSNAPDVTMIEGAWIGKLRESPALENLNEAPYNAGSLKDSFVEFKWDQASSVDGSRLAAIPWDIGPCSFYYRKDIFAEAGLPSEPDEVEKLIGTYDGLLQAAEAVYKPNERWLLPNAAYLYQWLFINRDYFNDKLELQLDRPGSIDALNAAITMRKNGWDAQTADMWTNEANAGFASGSIVAVVTGAWYGGFLKSWVSPDNAGNWAVAGMPCGVADSNWGGSFLAIPSQSKNKTAAWAFIDYMLTTPEAQNAMFQAVDYFPALKTAWDDKTIYEAEDPFFGGQKTKAKWVASAENILPVYTTMMDSGCEATILNAVNTGLNDGKDAAAIMAYVGEVITNETAEDRASNIDVLKDAGLWKE